MIHIQNDHLNEEQIAELIAAGSRELMQDPGLAALQAHASQCAECAAEIDTLRESIALFREASTAFAQSSLEAMPLLRVPERRPWLVHSAWWAAAAAAVALAVFVPFHINPHQPAVTPAAQPASIASRAVPAESDEALLEDVNRQLSRSVPSSMAALADPTSNFPASATNSTQRTD